MTKSDLLKKFIGHDVTVHLDNDCGVIDVDTRHRLLTVDLHLIKSVGEDVFEAEDKNGVTVYYSIAHVRSIRFG